MGEHDQLPDKLTRLLAGYITGYQADALDKSRSPCCACGTAVRQKSPIEDGYGHGWHFLVRQPGGCAHGIAEIGGNTSGNWGDHA